MAQNNLKPSQHLQILGPVKSGPNEQQLVG